MPKAHEIAIELRKVIDALEANPEVDHQKPFLWFYCDTKESFISAASIVPRPFQKKEDTPGLKYSRIHLEHNTPSLQVDVSVYKSLTCELVEPAKPAVYRCDPILSTLEEAQLNTEVL